MFYLDIFTRKNEEHNHLNQFITELNIKIKNYSCYIVALYQPERRVRSASAISSHIDTLSWRLRRAETLDSDNIGRITVLSIIGAIPLGLVTGPIGFCAGIGTVALVSFSSYIYQIAKLQSKLGRLEEELETSRWYIETILRLQKTRHQIEKIASIFKYWDQAEKGGSFAILRLARSYSYLGKYYHSVSAGLYRKVSEIGVINIQNELESLYRQTGDYVFAYHAHMVDHASLSSEFNGFAETYSADFDTLALNDHWDLILSQLEPRLADAFFKRMQTYLLTRKANIIDTISLALGSHQVDAIPGVTEKTVIAPIHFPPVLSDIILNYEFKASSLFYRTKATETKNNPATGIAKNGIKRYNNTFSSVQLASTKHGPRFFAVNTKIYPPIKPKAFYQVATDAFQCRIM
jgi:hypothetical protein